MKTQSRWRMWLTVAVWAGLGVDPAAAVARPSVRLLSEEPAAPVCGAVVRIDWQACLDVAACTPRRVDSAALAPLEAAITAAHARHMGRACSSQRCDAATPARAGENHFGCENATRVCLTRTLTSRCGGGADEPVAGSDRQRPGQRVRARPSEDTPGTPPPPARVRSAGTDSNDDDEGEILGARESTAAPVARGPRVQPARGGAAPTKYLFPGRAENLDAGEFWFWKVPDDHGSGTQKYAYDLTTARFYPETGQWSECVANADGKPKCQYCSEALRNSDCLDYGEPIYAMAAGTIVRCWRNAPENPKPGASHPGRTSHPKRIGGGGNDVVIQHDDGTVMLYAHMQPGSIPAALCPNNAELEQDADDGREREIPVGSQPRVQAGQKLGLVGNSGASGNPHTHVHRQSGMSKSSDGLPLDFAGALVATAGGDAEPDWSRLDGHTRPTQTSVVWPDYSKGFPEIAYHGVRSEDYQLLLDHVSGSGYRLDWIDGFEASGHVRFNVVFHPSDGKPWAAVHNLTGEQYQHEYDRRKAEGLRLRQVESYSAGGKVLYAAIFVKDGGPAVAAYHGRSAAEHQKLLEDWGRDGWRPRNVSVASVNGERVYAALYEKGSGGAYLKSALTSAEYQHEYDQNDDAGRHLAYLNAYVHDGQTYFSAIWDAHTPAPGLARHGLSGSDYQSLWEQARHDGLLTRGVTGYSSGGQVRFAAFWRR